MVEYKHYEVGGNKFTNVYSAISFCEENNLPLLSIKIVFYE